LFATVQKPEDDPAKAAFISKLREIPGFTEATIHTCLSIADRRMRKELTYMDSWKMIQGACGGRDATKGVFTAFRAFVGEGDSTNQTVALVSNWR
jgi:hypothetical protein